MPSGSKVTAEDKTASSYGWGIDPFIDRCQQQITVTLDVLQAGFFLGFHTGIRFLHSFSALF